MEIVELHRMTMSKTRKGARKKEKGGTDLRNAEKQNKNTDTSRNEKEH